jgi:NADH-quinone oxidoreductase subunit N
MPYENCLDLWAIAPELLLAGLIIVLVPMAGFVRGRWLTLPAVLAGIGLLGSMGLTVRMLPWEPAIVFCGTYAIDGLGYVFKLLIQLGAFISLLLMFAYFDEHPQIAQAPVALTIATLGAIGLTSSLDLGLIVLFLQMMSLASYLLVGLLRSNRLSNEATLKYFLFGAVALALMAYGLTFLYGLAGSLNLNDIGQALRGADRLWAGLAVGIVIIGYAFETTLVPFHFWAPDIYQGATAPVAGFLSVVPKIGGFAGLLRFLLLALPGELLNWPLGIAVLAILTMVVGNLLALRQTHMKRLLAYSSIAQAGYVLAALSVAGRIEGAIDAAGYYLATYLFMNLGAFIVVAQVERTTGSDLIVELRGFARHAPASAAILALSLLSLAGIPPLAGFVGKVLVLQAILDGGLVWLAVIVAANMVIGLYYYVAIAAEMYLKEPLQEQKFPGKPGYSISALISLSGTLLLGILPALALQLTGLLSRLVYSR